MFFVKLFTGWSLKRVVLSSAKLQCLPKICSQKCFCLFALAAVLSISSLVISVTLQNSLIVPHQRPLSHVVIF